jgi:hypothetical protein
VTSWCQKNPNKLHWCKKDVTKRYTNPKHVTSDVIVGLMTPNKSKYIYCIYYLYHECYMSHPPHRYNSISEKFKLCRSSLCNSLYFPLMSSLLIQIFSYTLWSKTSPNIHFAKVYRVSYRPTQKMIKFSLLYYNKNTFVVCQ